MLVSDIIANGRSLAAVPQTNFFTDSDALFAVQASWKDIYAILCDKNDDFFITQLYLVFADFTADINREFVYTYELPDDFYKLRLLQYKSTGPLFFPVEKMTIENFGNLQNSPGYRVMGTNVYIYTQVNYSTWCAFYYPAPVTLSTTTDLSYPNNMIPEIMAYQVAIEIRRKQNLDFADKQTRRDELIMSMQKQLNRDDAKAEQPKNTFAQGFAPYI